MQILLSRTQAGPGKTVKQEQEHISRNHVQTFSGGSVHLGILATGLVNFVLGPRTNEGPSAMKNESSGALWLQVSEVKNTMFALLYHETSWQAAPAPAPNLPSGVQPLHACLNKTTAADLFGHAFGRPSAFSHLVKRE